MEKFASFKMKEDESVPDMLDRIKMLVNDLKVFGEKVEDKDFSHKFMRFLPARFGMLVTLLVRIGLDKITPNQILGDIMTDDAYRDDEMMMRRKKRRRRKMRRRMIRRRVRHSKPHHHQRAKPSKIHLMKMMTQALMT
jgi:hypothetical protein